MKVKFKSKLSRALSLLLAANITLTCATSNMAYAAKTSSVMGSDSYLQQADITVGSTYSFGGYNWIAAEASGNKVILQSKGIKCLNLVVAIITLVILMVKILVLMIQKLKVCIITLSLQNTILLGFILFQIHLFKNKNPDIILKH